MAETQSLTVRAMALALLVAASASGQSSPIAAASCSQSDVASAIAAAPVGGTVNVPAGNCTWSGMSISKPVRLQGAGIGQTNITVSGSTVTKQAGGVILIRGFRFLRSGGGNQTKAFTIDGSWTNAEPVLFTDNDFVVSGSGLFLLRVAGGVIFARNSFSGGWDDSFIQAKDPADSQRSASTADTMGNRDTAGKLNVYVENNTFNGGTNQGIDADDAARVVYRYNTLTYSSFNTHGRDSSSVGVRHFEVYNNAFRHLGGTSQLANQNWAIWLRGGTGVIYNNQIDNVAGSYWGDKAEIKMSIRGAEDVRPQGACSDVRYPVPAQLGQNHNGTGWFTDPIYFWGNTGAQAFDAGWHWGNPCGLNFNNFFQWGRDAVNTNTPKPGYVAYAYPHPLTGSATPSSPPPGDTVAPSAPTNLSASATSTSQINLSWSASTDNVGVTGYRIERCSGANCTNFSALTTVTGTTFANSGLAAGTVYLYRVAATDAAGNVSGFSSIVSATTLTITAPPPPPPPSGLPSGSTGIASLYPGDTNIGSDPNVIFADDFESYSSPSQITSRWNELYQQQHISLATTTANVFAGARSLEMRIPQQSAEMSNAAVKYLNPTEDVIFMRAYTKFDAGFDGGAGSNHNGLTVFANYPGPGIPANGTNHFYVGVENSRELNPADPSPGPVNIYTYYPGQRSQWGDHWYPNGTVIPNSGLPGNFGSSFVSRPNFIPQRDRWYCYELMVRANTPGLNDGRIAVWIDGVVIADFPNVRLRDVSSLKINRVALDFYIGNNSIRANTKWYDNVVIARSYIGPASVGAPAVPPAPPTNLVATPR